MPGNFQDSVHYNVLRQVQAMLSLSLALLLTGNGPSPVQEDDTQLEIPGIIRPINWMRWIFGNAEIDAILRTGPTCTLSAERQS